jgi:hypothetical protein
MPTQKKPTAAEYEAAITLLEKHNAQLEHTVGQQAVNIARLQTELGLLQEELNGKRAESDS